MTAALIPLALLGVVVYAAVRLFRWVDRRIDLMDVHPDDRPPGWRRRISERRK